MNEQLKWPENNDDTTVASLSIHWMRFLRFLGRKWWIPALTLTLFVAGQLFYMRFRPEMHEVEGRLVMGGKVKIPEEGLYSEEWQNFFGTQIALMRSPKVQALAAEAMRSRHQLQNPCPVSLEVTQPRKTTIFELLAKGSDVNYTSNFLNTVMEQYLALRKDERNKSSDETINSLTGDFIRVGKELDADRDAVHAFENTNSIQLLEEQTSSQGLPVRNADLDNLKLEMATLKATETTRQGTSVDSKVLEEAGVSVEKSGANLSAEQYLQSLENEKQDKIKEHVWRSEHPKMVELDERIKKTVQLIQIYTNDTLGQLQARETVLEAKIAGLTNLIHNSEDRVLVANRLINDYNALKEKRDRTQESYNHLDHLLEQLKINEGVDQEAIVTLDDATVLESRFSLLKFILWPIVGLILGIGILAFVASSSDRLTSIAEAKLRFPERILARIPDVAGKSGESPGLLERDDDRLALAESYRNLHSALLFMGSGESRPKTIVIASAMSGDGKTTVAMNLARTMVFAGSRVLVIDGDLRAGRLHAMLGMPPEEKKSIGTGGESANGHENGNGKASGNGSLLLPTPLENMVTAARREIFGQSGERFLHPQTGKLLKELSGQFDFVLIDTAPVFAAADAASLAPKVDGVVFVVRDFYTPARLASEALDHFHMRHANVLGIVYNRANGASRHTTPLYAD